MTKYTLQTEFASAYDAQARRIGPEKPIVSGRECLAAGPPRAVAVGRVRVSAAARRTRACAKARPRRTPCGAWSGPLLLAPSARLYCSDQPASASAMDVDAAGRQAGDGAASALRRAPAALTVVIDEGAPAAATAPKWGMSTRGAARHSPAARLRDGHALQQRNARHGDARAFWDARQDAAAKTAVARNIVAKNPEESVGREGRGPGGRRGVAASLRRDKSVLTQQLPPRNVESRTRP